MEKPGAARVVFIGAGAVTPKDKVAISRMNAKGVGPFSETGRKDALAVIMRANNMKVPVEEIVCFLNKHPQLIPPLGSAWTPGMVERAWSLIPPDEWPGPDDMIPTEQAKFWELLGELQVACEARAPLMQWAAERAAEIEERRTPHILAVGERMAS